MSYEYKDEIIMNLKDYNAGRKVVVGGTNAFESKIEELHEVYAQVSEYEQHKVATTILVNTLKSKANEYEAKAKAFDRIKSYSDKAINGDIHSLELAEGIMDVVEQYEIQRLLESGERNER